MAILDRLLQIRHFPQEAWWTKENYSYSQVCGFLDPVLQSLPVCSCFSVGDTGMPIRWGTNPQDGIMATDKFTSEFRLCCTDKLVVCEPVTFVPTILEMGFRLAVILHDQGVDGVHVTTNIQC